MRFNSPQDYIGKIVSIKLPYYDTKKSQISYKARPGLIIGCENSQFPCDFTYLFQKLPMSLEGIQFMIMNLMPTIVRH